MNELDIKILDLAGIGCTPEEIIAELDLGCNIEQFELTHKALMTKGKLKYQVRIKRAQADLGLTDPAALKWLAQVHLGQTDKHSPILKQAGKYDEYTREQLLNILSGVTND